MKMHIAGIDPLKAVNGRISHFFRLFNSGSLGPVASMPRRYKKKAGFDPEGVVKLSRSHDGEVVLPTLNATNLGLINASQRSKLFLRHPQLFSASTQHL